MTQQQTEPFSPSFLLKAGYLQSILASNKLRLKPDNPVTIHSKKIILEVNDNIRLLGFHSPQRGRKSKGIVIVLHGWEGSSNSAYVLATSRFLMEGITDLLTVSILPHGTREKWCACSINLLIRNINLFPRKKNDY